MRLSCDLPPFSENSILISISFSSKLLPLVVVAAEPTELRLVTEPFRFLEDFGLQNDDRDLMLSLLLVLLLGLVRGMDGEVISKPGLTGEKLALSGCPFIASEVLDAAEGEFWLTPIGEEPGTGEVTCAPGRMLKFIEAERFVGDERLTLLCDEDLGLLGCITGEGRIGDATTGTA